MTDLEVHTGMAKSNIFVDQELIKRDMKIINSFLKNKLFEKVKFINSNDNLQDEMHPVYKFFQKVCRERLGEGKIRDEETRNQYCCMIWKYVCSRPNKQRKLNREKLPIRSILTAKWSGVYIVMQTRFVGKVNKKG